MHCHDGVHQICGVELKQKHVALIYLSVDLYHSFQDIWQSLFNNSED